MKSFIDSVRIFKDNKTFIVAIPKHNEVETFQIFQSEDSSHQDALSLRSSDLMNLVNDGRLDEFNFDDLPEVTLDDLQSELKDSVNYYIDECA
jgi:hypothetical protein